MLRLARDLKGYMLGAEDGEIGKVKEFYFDDQRWTIRYLVADTGGWLGEQAVLISPYALRSVHTEDKLIPVKLTKLQIENSPPLGAHKPVSRQYELMYYPYYDWPMYWGGSSVWGDVPYPSMAEGKWSDHGLHATNDEPHLRSTNDADGHTIHGIDGDIGHVKDFVIDDESWTIRYLIVDTRDWWPGKKVLISTQWVDRISWKESTVYLKLTRKSIQSAPEYSENLLITRDYETKLHLNYNLEGYWQKELEHTHTR